VATYSAPKFLPSDIRNLRERFQLKSLLTAAEGNAKTAKSNTETVILHHLPERSLSAAIGGFSETAVRSAIPGLKELAESNNVLSLAIAHNGCRFASAGCREGCLAFSGHGGLSVDVTGARARRDLAQLFNSKTYSRAIVWEIAASYAKAKKKGSKLAVRLRGTNDHPWHRERIDLTVSEAQSIARRYGAPVIPGNGQTIIEVFQCCEIIFYDYSKAPNSGPLGLMAQRYAGFDVTASLAADRPYGIIEAIRAVQNGFRLAVPLAIAKGHPIPREILLQRDSLSASLQCIDGDTSDERFLDSSNCAVILRTKKSRGANMAIADKFSLSPSPSGVWQPLAGGGETMLTW
jgi:hypothetical protein